ncbi:MAG: calcium/sodium antiporter [Candidatus Diapherotrites archaeon]|nr:calcium/sodium antiporter [Candidatus Diapherotrites archaeon]
MFESLIILVVALAILSKSSNWVVDSSVMLARFLRISEFTIGFLVIAVVTSLPELLVSAFAAMAGSGNLAVANVIGSNIANIAFVLGIAAVFGTIHFRRGAIGENAEVLLIITIIPLLLLNSETLGLRGGIILLTTFILYSIYLYRNSNTKKHTFVEVKDGQGLAKNALLFILGIALVLISAQYVVTAAVDVAKDLGISDAVIGLTVIAFGTSIPELATTIAAVRKGKSSLAVGNIIGSCVANLTLVLGISAILGVLTISLGTFSTSITFLVGITIFLWYILFKNKGISTLQGLFMVTVYLLFIITEAGLIVFI